MEGYIMKYTRKDYMSKKCSHDEYYAQFVNSSVLHLVKSFIGEAKIKKSTDPHFNDIPLKQWDTLNTDIRYICGRSISESNASTCAEDVKQGGISLSDTVCVAKAAARQIKAE